MAKKFQFRLEALKRFRENRLLLARKELIAVETRVFEAKQAITRAQSDRVESLVPPEAGLRLLYADLVVGETARIRRLEGEVKQLESERERHAHWVTHLGRELKAIEKLEERKREQHEHDIKLAEKRSVDDWVSERWAHTPAAQAVRNEEEEFT